MTWKPQKYSGERFAIEEYISKFHPYIGLQIREFVSEDELMKILKENDIDPDEYRNEIIKEAKEKNKKPKFTASWNSPKLFYNKNSEKGFDALMSKDPFEKFNLYYVLIDSDGAPITGKNNKPILKFEQTCKNDFLEKANDGSTVPRDGVILDIDFAHKEVDLLDTKNQLHGILRDFEEKSINYSLYATDNGRSIKIYVPVKKIYSLDEDNQRKVESLQSKIGEVLKQIVLKYTDECEVKKGNGQCSLCYPALEGKEPIHTKTGMPIKIQHYTGSNNELSWFEEQYEEIKRIEESTQKEDINNFLDIRTNDKGEPTKITVDYDAVADYIIDKYNIRTIYDLRVDTIEIYDDGIWKPTGKGIVVSEVEKLLKNHAKNSVVSEVLEKVKRKTETTREETEIIPDYLLPLKNCVLDLSNAENIKQLAHNPKFNFRKRMPVNYDLEAECPNIMGFINKTFYPCDIPQVQEYGGMHLVRRYLFKKGCICQGEKNTGKTVWLNLLASFCGEENVSGLSLQKITGGKSFDLIALKDSFANIYDELSSKDLSNSGECKKSIGDGFLTGEWKFGAQIRFRNVAKHTFACNKIPSVKDVDDDAYYDRWLVWSFENVVPKEKRNKSLIDELTTEKELSGLLNWFIEGYKRLIKQNGFSNEKSCEEIKDLMVQNGNALARFASEVLEFELDSKLTKDDLYNVYCNWCQNQKPQLSPESMDKIGKSLTKFAPFVANRKSGSQRYWGNVKIRDKWDIFKKNMYDEKENIPQKNIDVFFSKESQESHLNSEPEEMVVTEEEIEENPSDSIIPIISETDAGGGVDLDVVIDQSDFPKETTEEIINKLRTNGEIFEIKPNKWKVLK